MCHFFFASGGEGGGFVCLSRVGLRVCMCVCVSLPVWLHEITRQRSGREFRFSIDLPLVCGSVGGWRNERKEVCCVVLWCVV